MKILKLATLFFSLLITSSAIGQTYNFTLTVQNQTVDGTDFIFDIYMVRTGDTDIYLGDCDFVLTFNNGNFTSPTTSVVTAATRLWDNYSLSPAIVSSNRIVLSVGKPTWNDQEQFNDKVQVISTSGNGTLISQIKITGITTPSGTAGLQWRTSDANMTQIHRLDNSTPWDMPNINSSGTYTDPPDESLPVQMTNLMAVASQEEGITLSWRTESETDCAGFHVWRSLIEGAEYTCITTTMIPGQGNSSSAYDYRWNDRNVEDDVIYYYKIEEISIDGTSKFFGPVEVKGVSPIPKEFALSRNYPNPFNPETTIDYQVADECEVILKIYSLLGQEVKELVNHKHTAGYHSTRWDGTDFHGNQVTTGIYFLIMKTGNFTKTRRMTLMR